jgi:hypothetical protein
VTHHLLRFEHLGNKVLASVKARRLLTDEDVFSKVS